MIHCNVPIHPGISTQTVAIFSNSKQRTLKPRSRSNSTLTGPRHGNRSISHLLVGISQACNINTHLPILLGNRVWVDSLGQMSLLLFALLLDLHVRAFDTIKTLGAATIYVSEVACSIVTARAILVIEGFAERLQAAVDQRARTWGGQRVGTDTEVDCWQLDDDFLDCFIGRIDGRIDECWLVSRGSLVVRSLCLSGCTCQLVWRVRCP